MNHLRNELSQLRLDVGFIQKEYCPKEKEKEFRKMEKEKIELPKDIQKDEVGYFKYIDADLTEDEKKELIRYRKITYLHDIKTGISVLVGLVTLSFLISLVILFKQSL